VFASYFRFLGIFFASQKTGLSAAIPQPRRGACGIYAAIPYATFPVGIFED
jgi:hypothetical protein